MNREESVQHFLDLLKKSRRGNFKVYIGMIAGVGKSYRMLSEAHELLRSGIDVRIGYIETHGRTETEALVGGLPLIPRRKSFYKGKEVEDMDLDAILNIHPEVVVVDELAHTNIEGSKNEKRWQDVMDILEAGISVITAVNIQHLEGLNEEVQDIAGIEVKERIPDSVLEQADEVVNIDLTAASEQTFHYAVLNLPAFQGVMYTAIVLILWFGGNMILKKQLAVGNLTGFLSYVMQVMNSMMMIANVFLLLTRSMASAHRIVEVLDEKIVLTSPENGVTEVTEGSVEFDNVSFKYKEEAKEYALSDVTLKIKAGQTVGILGGTGSSKTTLVQLIPRLYDTSRGTVRVGGKDVRAYDLAALRDAVNIILQKNVLFSGTVRENLKWGNADASDKEIWEACRAACADEFLNRMPDGLDTVLEQGASNLSGGQKQRLCIARALIGKAKILIFDDSTSAVDTATEKKIREALAARKDVTKIIIAQRVTSVMNTDQIIILDDGKVHRIGTHAELLADDQIYQEIYASQMKGGDENGSESL